MQYQCDKHRRDHDSREAAKQIAHIKQAKRNRREWLRRAADACRKGHTHLARNLIVRAEQEFPATYEVRTPRGGAHLYYKCQQPINF